MKGRWRFDPWSNKDVSVNPMASSTAARIWTPVSYELQTYDWWSIQHELADVRTVWLMIWSLFQAAADRQTLSVGEWITLANNCASILLGKWNPRANPTSPMMNVIVRRFCCTERAWVDRACLDGTFFNNRRRHPTDSMFLLFCWSVCYNFYFDTNRPHSIYNY